MRRLAVAGLATLLLLSACGEERSVEAFCRTFHDGNQRLSAKYQQRLEEAQAQDPLFSLFVATGSLVEAQGDTIVLMKRLEAVAPDEIRPEVETVREHLEREMELLAMVGGDPLGMLFAGLLSSGQVAGSYERVESFVTSNCL